MDRAMAPSAAAVVADIVELLTRGDSAVLVAPPGHGLTTALREVTSHLRAHLIAGHDAVEDAPLLPLAPLLARAELHEASVFTTLARLPALLLQQRARLAVDDADRLDPGSQVLISQTVRAGVPTVIGVPSTVGLPEVLRDVVLSLPRFTIAPLDRAQTEAMAATRTGERLDPPSANAVWRRSRGVPAVICDLVDQAVAAGHSRHTPAGIHLAKFSVQATSLSAQGLDSACVHRHRGLVHRLAVCGPLPCSILDPAELSGAIADRLVIDDGTQASLASPLLRDWSLTRMSHARRAAVGLEVAAELEGVPGYEALARSLRVMGSADASSAVPPEDVDETAQWLHSIDRLDEALLLLDRYASHGSETVQRRVVLAMVLSDLGEVDRAVSVLERAAASASGQEAGRVAWMLADLHSGSDLDDKALRRRLAPLVSRLDPDVQVEVNSVLARRQVIRGGLEPGGRSDPLAGLIRESLTGSLEAARVGSEITPSGGQAEATREGRSLEQHLRVLIHFLSLVYDGRLVEGREIADREYAAAQRHIDPVMGLWSYNRTKIRVHAGQYGRATHLGEAMLRELRWRDPFGLLASAAALQGSALARSDRLDEAEELVAGLGSMDLSLPRARIGVARVRAQRALGRGDIAAGGALLHEASQYALANDEAHSGLLALDEAFWLDPTRTRASLLVSHESASALVGVFARRARARMVGDENGLEESARDLEAMVQPGRAAATWLEVARRRTARGDQTAAGRAHRQAVRLELLWGCRAWPTPAVGSPLTERELAVARRAAARVRSKEIAEHLGLSVRTVDNHLARASRKLGVGGREELAQVLGLLDPAGG